MTRRLAFFDLDGTIIGSPSTERSFLSYLVFHNILGIKQYFHTFIFLLRWAYKYKQYVFLKDKAYLTGLSVSKINALAKKITHEELLPRIRPCVKARIEAHHRAKERTILLTGSHDFIAKIFAEHLGMDEVYATKCHTENGHFTSEPPLAHPFRQEKLTIAQAVAASHGVSLEDCTAYGNSRNDAILLGAVGHKVAVSPDIKLRRLALSKGWEVLL